MDAFFLVMAFNKCKYRYRGASPIHASDGSTTLVVLKHTWQSVMLMLRQRKSCVTIFLVLYCFLQTIAVFVRWRGLSVWRACLPLSVPSCQARQSSWLHEGHALSRSIKVVAKLSHQKLGLRLCQSTFFFCHRPLWLYGGLDATCRLSTAFFFLLSPQTFHPSNTCFDSLPFRLKFLWLESAILATSNYASTWLSCDREEEAENEI